MKSTIPLTPVDSNQLVAYGYDEATGTLAITFRNKSGTSLPYHYPCTPETWKELQAAESKGKFFNQRILKNPAMPATKMVPDAEEAAGKSESNTGGMQAKNELERSFSENSAAA